MKIVQLTGNYSLNGGVGTYVRRVSEKLAQSGHEVSVIHADPRIGNLAGNPALFCVENFDAYVSEVESLRLADGVLKKLREIKPDVVHVQSNNNFFLEDLICREFSVVKSIHVYDFCPAGTKFHGLLQKSCSHSTGLGCIPRMLYKRCAEDKNPATLWMFYRRAAGMIKNDEQHSVIFAASDYVREQMLASGYRPDQVRVLPYFTGLPENPAGPQEGTKIILASGRMVPEKGIDRLLYAVSYIRLRQDWKVVLDGAGAAEPKLRSLAYKLGLQDRVEFAGWLEPAKHWEIFKRCFMLVVPSIWPEPFGLVGIEAMSYAKPVVAFRVGGISTWLEHGRNGFLIPAYDVEAMGAKIKELIESPERSREMGLRGRERVAKEFSPEKHLEGLCQGYEFAMNKKKAFA